VDGAPIGASVADGVGDGVGVAGASVEGAGLVGGVVGGLEVGVAVAVGVAVPEPGALAVKKVADADPPAFGDPDPVQAETVSAASTVMVLHKTAASRARIRMKPPDDPGRCSPSRLKQTGIR
jgi:hypothetical protein